ncbi:MAG: hypothetical protein IIC91_12210 [Chloroflexi bacterium]|nr:hypothetical protein [Chloroflexota bacterium]
MAEDAGLEARPDPVTALSGVYLAGDWVGSEGWLADASLASAKRAADAALEANATRARAHDDAPGRHGLGREERVGT